MVWKNDFTLSLDLNALDFETAYTMTIDGSIAKNSRTNDLFDGDADGVASGNYVLQFTTAPPDLEPPYIVSYDPESNAPGSRLTNRTPRR